jgi:hypothetical protein
MRALAVGLGIVVFTIGALGVLYSLKGDVAISPVVATASK